MASRSAPPGQRGLCDRLLEAARAVLHQEVDVGTADAVAEAEVHRARALVQLRLTGPVHPGQDGVIRAYPELQEAPAGIPGWSLQGEHP